VFFFINWPISLLVTGGALVILVLAFFWFFGFSVRHWFRLRGILASVSAFEERTPPGEFKKLFAKDKRLAHLWSEYQDSLHIQREERDGQMQVVAVRSTVPAEAYFNSQYVVDSRLGTDFFKHLPGIFTGLGIIGTFMGLMNGLHSFQVSENAATVRTSLESLMHAVGEAFLISASAIIAAMVATFLEKVILTALYAKTEAIAHAIDARFETGAGEEYLSRIVRASEDSASQAKMLKDALVKELGDLLRELTAAQVGAAREDNKALGDAIAGSIERSLKGPLEAIASTVNTVTGDQSASAVQMLNDVMVSFSQRLNDLFGGQINGINELNKQTGQGMQDAVNALNVLVGKMEETGRRSSDDIAAQMAASLKAMEERQNNINAQTQTCVEQIQQLVASSQTETQQKLHATLQAMGEQMATILSTLNKVQTRAFEEHRVREEGVSQRTNELVSSMTGSVETAVNEMATASKIMAQSVSTLSMATNSSVEKMNIGAERLGTAASSFATAGDRVTGVMNLAATVSSKLTEVSGSLTTSASAVQDALRDYRTQREAVSQLLTEVRVTVELARREASLTADVLARIEASTAKLGTAQQAADIYLDGVNQVLAKSSEAFRESVVSTLSKVNYDFHTKLGHAVGLLSNSVQELEVTLGSVAPRR
jgi:hypothetical protein